MGRSLRLSAARSGALSVRVTVGQDGVSFDHLGLSMLGNKRRRVRKVIGDCGALIVG
jgi:hypothetical protein